MSESETETLGGAPPDAVPAAPEPVEAPAPVSATAEELPGAVDLNGTRMVPIGVVQALREELRSRPKAEDFAQLQQAYEDARPYVDFVRSNPTLMTPPAPAPVPPESDPQLVELARTMELYDPNTGLPDTKRAQAIRDMTRREAEAIAEARLAPVRETSQESAATENIKRLMADAAAQGSPIEAPYLLQAVQSITATMPKAEAMRLLSDPRVVDVVGLTALGLQARQKRPASVAPAAPERPALYTEGAGGVRPEVPMSDGSRRLAKLTGRSEKDWVESAKRYVPGRANSLE
jgi:hypothetical protein